MVLSWVVAIHLAVGQHADQAILKGFLDLGGPRVNSLATFMARLCDPSPWIYFAAVPILVALGRRRPRVALAVAVILIGANASTQLLKPLLAAPRAQSLLGNLGHVSAASWPSGHATAAMSLALAAVLAAPARWRGLMAAIGAAFAVAVSYSFLTLGWHYPSDVLGGFAIAGAWALGAVGVLFALEARRSALPPELQAAPARQATPSGPAPVTSSLRRTLRPAVLALAGALGLAGLVALARPHEVVAYARAHEAMVIGAPAIALLGLLVATAVSLALRR